jgi:sugar phosphate isomerase/epimerase
MSETKLNRRQLLKGVGALGAAAILPEITKAETASKLSPFVFSLNMSTIRGHKLGFVKELETASKAGFRSVEIWMDSFQTYLSKGGTVSDAKKRVNDLGLKIENCIGFAKWIVDDEGTRNEGLEQMKKEMNLLAELGCKRTAAPPMGATDTEPIELKRVAERYRAILELGEQTGVTPQLEMWGFSKNLSKVSEVLFVAAESSHPSSKLLLDVYHIYKGDSSLDSLPLVGKAGLEIFHVNDYPAQIKPAKIADTDRIYPGDGAAPISKILKALKKDDKPLIISFEVFNENYYKQDPLKVAQTALLKMRAVTQNI